MRIKFGTTVVEYTTFEAVVGLTTEDTYNITFGGVREGEAEFDYFATDLTEYEEEADADRAAASYAERVARYGYLDLSEIETIEIW